MKQGFRLVLYGLIFAITTFCTTAFLLKLLYSIGMFYTSFGHVGEVWRIRVRLYQHFFIDARLSNHDFFIVVWIAISIMGAMFWLGYVIGDRK